MATKKTKKAKKTTKGSKRESKPAPKKAARKGRPTLRRAPVAASGPVTLAEARALARPAVAPADALGRGPRRAARRAVAAAREEMTVESVAKRREVLERQQDAERKQRIADYRATLAVMKKRGATGAGKAPPAGVGRRREAGPRRAPKTAAGFKPLQVFAEGDSWFDYPPFLLRGGIIPRLEARLGVPVLNLAKAGDEARFMLGVKERNLLADQLSKGCPAGGPWDALLFSGGGNDITDNPMALWVRDFNPTIPSVDHIHPARFVTALDLVRAAYEDLIEVRDRLSPNTHLFFHAYDYAIPGLGGVCHLGPWLSPTFDLRKFPLGSKRTEVVKAMLDRFVSMLGALAAAHPKVTLIPTQGTLAPQPSSWHNELHPSKKGFEKLADLFRDELKKVFPDRVL